MRLLRPLLFRLDAEVAHNLALRAIAMGLIRAKPISDPTLQRQCFGIQFPNPIGLAAGFDKSGIALNRWKGLGFGFVEIGTVTPKAQPGNHRPRLFRLERDKAIINRMGFNNDGATAVAKRLQEFRSRKGGGQLVIGVNIGKQRETSLEEAPRDYIACYQLLAPFADYIAVNVSSPNTPGLRELQNRDSLREILSELSHQQLVKPILVKIAPDLSREAVQQVVEVCVEKGAKGLIATNTTTSRPGLVTGTQEDGGLSGEPLRPLSNEVLAWASQAAPKDFTLVGAGGVFTGSEMAEKFRLGAHLAQIYTGWIYGGPQAIPRILNEYLSLR